jgi:hypothetical protein
MSFDRLVELKIREAIENGEFEHLEGEGHPVDLDTYFACPEELRAGHTIMKNARVLPPEMELLREVNELKAKLQACNDPARQQDLNRQLNEAMLKFNLQMERFRQSRRR